MADPIRTSQFPIEYFLARFNTVRTSQFPIEYLNHTAQPIRTSQYVIEYIRGRQTDQSCAVANDFGAAPVAGAACDVPDAFGTE